MKKLTPETTPAATEKPLFYDRETAEKWKNTFDVCTPQECADLFQKPVQDENKIYYPTPPAKLCVCDRCLMAIESREGSQLTRKIYLDDDDPRPCDWCEESDFDILYEIQ